MTTKMSKMPQPGFSPTAELSFSLTESLHNKNFQRKGHRKNGQRVWNYKEFIAWDGEGLNTDVPTFRPVYTNLDGEVIGVYDHGGEKTTEYTYEAQKYVLLANSKGDMIKDRDGLSTKQCFDMILDAKEQYPDSIFVGFSFNYDVNQMLADVPLEVREYLYNHEGCYNYGGYLVKWHPGKSFTVTHRKTRRSAIIYDVFGFFQTSFLEACREYLGKDDPDLVKIQLGKEARQSFQWNQMDDFIIPYCKLEVSMTVRVMDQLRSDLHEVGIDPARWHGPGAIANEVLKKFGVPISRDVPEEVLDAAQHAYAGGRFEQFKLGKYDGPVYEYDIHSAYPAAAIQLPDLCDGSWEYVETFEPGTFGVWYIQYGSTEYQALRVPEPGPLFCRSENGSISFPPQVSGWYWTPEASLVADSVCGGWVFRSTSTYRPFAFIAELYDERRILKSQNRSAQRAVKLILNSLYGKLAQTVGGKKGPPRWHQLEYAGFITSYTRAMIYKAVSLKPDAIIAVETDAVFSTQPLDLPCTDDLGDWELTEYAGITYLQSGYYYAQHEGKRDVCKYRGMDRDGETMQPVGLPYREVLDHLARWSGSEHWITQPLVTTTTRFIGLGMALQTSAVWRSWQKVRRQISLDQDARSSKRYHMSYECPECEKGMTLADGLHTMYVGGYSGKSYARALPWRHLEEKPGNVWHEAPESLEEWQEMNQEFLALEEADRWS